MTLATTASQPVTPFLYYQDVEGAIEWLTSAFGFTERMRLAGPGAGVAHAEVTIGGGVIMIGNVGPRNAGRRPQTVRSGVYVYVDDVDRHCEQARAAGAEIVREPADQSFGDRIYLAVDREGHEWYFAQHLRDVSLNDLERSLRR